MLHLRGCGATYSHVTIATYISVSVLAISVDCAPDDENATVPALLGLDPREEPASRSGLCVYRIRIKSEKVDTLLTRSTNLFYSLP